MILIDGSEGEGGGAILRVATSLSAITGKPVKISNIRKGRSQPGLKTQHLESIRVLAEICGAELKGAELGSTEIEFIPSKIVSKNIESNIATAGSPGLLFQNIKIPASLGEGETMINVKGGAVCGLGAPPIPYLQRISLPTFEKLGYKSSAEIKKYGFYPAGGAETEFKIQPWKERKPISLLDRGEIKTVGGISIASEHLKSSQVAERQAKSASHALSRFKPFIVTKYVESINPGSLIVLWATTSTGCILGADALGERKKSAEVVGEEAGRNMLKTIGSKTTVDPHLSDQLLIFMSLVKGKSEFTTRELTKHAETNMWVIKKFLDVDFKVEKLLNGVKITCSGLK